MDGVQQSQNLGRMRFCAVGLALFMFLLAGASGSLAEDIDSRFAPFYFSDDLPRTIVLNGEIDVRTALRFRRALAEKPETTHLVLNSPGGAVQIALLIAEEVRERRMTTTIARESWCLSACAFVFLAGTHRQAEGSLGVHQIYSEEPDSNALQLHISDILETLNRFQTPQAIITQMLRTPADDMYLYGPAELAALGVLGSVEDDTVSPGTEFETSDRVPNELPTSEEVADWYLAVYPRLDFWGGDLVSKGLETETIGECAASCADEPQCRVFTFNVSQKRCFLKKRVEISILSEGAQSGVFLPSSHGSAPSADPIVAEFVMRQSHSYSFFNNPFAQPSAGTLDACLRSCRANGTCRYTTFTFGNQRPCRIWSAIPGALVRNSKAVSFDKIYQPVTPADVLALPRAIVGDATR